MSVSAVAVESFSTPMDPARAIGTPVLQSAADYDRLALNRTEATNTVEASNKRDSETPAAATRDVKLPKSPPSGTFDDLGLAATPQPVGPAAPVRRMPPPPVEVPPQQTAALPTTRPVVAIGDSLTVGSQNDLDALLGDRLVVSDAFGGRGSRDAVTVLSRYEIPPDAVVVFALGTNDQNAYQAFRDTLDEALSLLGPRNDLVLLTVSRPDGLHRLNQAMFDAMGDDARISVADWAAVTDADRSLMAADGVHLTTAGYRQRAEFIVEHIDGLGESNARATTTAPIVAS